MTNHPQRRRDLTAEAERELAALQGIREDLMNYGLPVPGPDGERAAEAPPAHTGNGVPPGLKPEPAVPAAKAVAQTLGEHLPNMLFQAMTAALSQAVVQVAAQRPPCATCIIERIAWENAHRAEMEAAITAAGSPQADLAPFLPEALLPGAPRGMPVVAQRITTFQGAEACPPHLAQAAGVQQGRSSIIPVAAALNPAMLRQLAGTR